MDPTWYRNAVIYQADVALFADSDGDGWGDLRGMTDRLEHMRGMGATACWLNPFYGSPYRDGGYDISDHLNVDPRFGDLADFALLVDRAECLGLRIIVDLVMQHTSDQHPWFQEARSDRQSPYRGYYVWADEPEDTELEPVFPDVEDSVWTWDDEAQQFYRHCFYHHEPDLDLSNVRVREELYRTMAFWLRLGVSGFRVDAVPYMVERARAADQRTNGMWLLDDMRRFTELRSRGAVLIGEADAPPQDYDEFVAADHRLNLVLDFWLNNHLFLALARQEAQPLIDALKQHQLPPGLGATFLRNHDELDLERLSEADRNEVFDVFAPKPEMRIYNRGIRRRVAPMLDGDTQRLAMAHALLLSLPGSPVLRYGDEIGMGDDLSRSEREAVRTPMQWSDGLTGGFSSVDPRDLPAPVVNDGFGPKHVNVYDQLTRSDSLLARVGNLARARVGSPEIAGGEYSAVEGGSRAVLCLQHRLRGNTIITAVNLSDEPAEFCVPGIARHDLMPILADVTYGDEGDGASDRYRLGPYGYRWFRRRTERDRL
jgi:maltose alpha-D-glucosyltransferase/alpha-amylase